MKNKEWLHRILCFVSGVIVAGMLFVTLSSINKAEAGTNAVLPQDLSQRVASLEQRVARLEKGLDSLNNEKQDKTPPCRGKECE